MDNITRQSLLEACEGDVELAEQMAGLLLKNIPKRLNAVKEAFSINDFKGLAKEAHGLKSASCYISSATIQEICRKLEKCENAEDKSQLGALIKLLDQECTNTLKKLGP